MKKALIIFSIMMITLLCGVSVLASETDDTGVWEYQEYEGGIVLTKYTGPQTDVYVPSNTEVGGESLQVTKLGENLFKYNTALNSATLGEGITEIGASAFEGATNLVCIVTPESLTTIGAKAFSGCSNFNSVILYDGVANIGESAFADCEKLVIYCNENSKSHSYSKENNISYIILNPDLSPETVTIDEISYYVGNGEVTLLKCPTTKTGSVVIPTEVNGFPVTKINNDAFSGCASITQVSIPDTVIYIGANAFYKCSTLKTANIPKGLKEIPSSMFSSCYQLTNMEIPFGVTKIGGGAFSFCYQITSMVLPETVTSIGNSAFWYCSRLYSVNIPSGVTELGEGVFYMNKFSSIELPECLTTIPSNLFSDCVNLKSITIPDGVTLIDSFAFGDCTSLTEIVIPEGVTRTAYCAFSGCTALKVVTIPTTLTDMHNNTAFSGCNAITDVYYNGSRTQWNKIPSISSSVLYGANLHYKIASPVTEFSLAKSQMDIYMGSTETLKYSFTPEYPDNENIIWSSSNEDILTVTDGVITGVRMGTATVTATTEDGGYADSCEIKVGYPRGTVGNLQWYVSEDGCLYIEGKGEMSTHSSSTIPWANAKELFDRVIIGDGVTKIGNYAFYECSNIKEISIPESVTVLGDYCFYGCSSLASIELPEGIPGIPYYAFYRCSSLKSIVLPDSASYIADRGFYYSGLNTITIGKGMRNIAWQAFDGCSFTKVNIVDLSTWALINFEYSSSNPLSRGTGMLYCNDEPVYDVVLPEGITKVGGAFSGYKYLRSIKIPDSVTSLANNVFHNCTALESVVLPSGITRIPTYAFNNCQSLTSIVIPDSVTYMADCIFSGCTSLKSVKLSKNLKTLKRLTFYNCPKLTDITLPKGLTTLEESIFHSCKSLKEIVVPDSVTSIGETVFYQCSSLESVKIGSGLKTIPKSTFQYCSSLKNIELPRSLTGIGDQAFYNCSSLKSLELPDLLTSIGNSAFSGTNLTNIELPESLTSIGSSAFYKCQFTDISFPGSLKTIGSNAFSHCGSLKNVMLNEGLTTISSSAFSNCTSLKKIIIPESVTSLATNAFSGDTIILCVYSGSTAHTVCLNNNIPYFILKKTSNPEISYGSSISGTVTFTDGTAASGTTVEILYDDGTVKQFRTTDSNGAYSFDYAEVGRYTIRATDTDGNTASEIVSVKRMNVFDVYLAGETDLVLKKGYTLSGTVSPATATVTLTDTDGNVISSTETTDGTFSFENVPNGTYILKAETENGTAIKEITIFNADITGEALTVEVIASATITGYVEVEDREFNRHKRNWVEVTIYNEAGIEVDSQKTSDDGSYTFKNLPLGDYSIVAETHEMRPDKHKHFDRSHKLTGFAYVEATEAKTYENINIVLYEENDHTATISGQIKVRGETKDCEVILTNVFKHEIAKYETGKNGKYTFKNIPDGLYFITATSKSDGMGYAVVVVHGGKVYGETDIVINKPQKFYDRETKMHDDIPQCANREDALKHRDRIAEEKRYYDGLSEKEKKHFSKEYVERLNRLCKWIADSSYSSSGDVEGRIENEGTIISGDELDSEEKIELILNITKTNKHDIPDDGIKTREDFEQQSINDHAKGKHVANYYDITLTKNGKPISNVRKHTDTTGKLRITMDIPEEYRGHKHYSFIHMHKGEAITLVDLDDNPNTVTFEVDKFSTFALAYSDVELVGEVEETIYPANITYDAETGKISVSSTEDGTLYIATYNGTDFEGVVSYAITANATAEDYDFNSNQAAFLWNENLEPLCEKFTIEN